jgi:hypothetical protein
MKALDDSLRKDSSVTEWQALIPKCFGRDLVFAGTPAELASAWQLRAKAKEAGLSSTLVEGEIRDWLHTETSNTGQLFEQMERVRSFLGS